MVNTNDNLRVVKGNIGFVGNIDCVIKRWELVSKKEKLARKVGKFSFSYRRYLHVANVHGDGISSFLLHIPCFLSFGDASLKSWYRKSFQATVKFQPNRRIQIWSSHSLGVWCSFGLQRTAVIQHSGVRKTVSYNLYLTVNFRNDGLSQRGRDRRSGRAAAKTS